jgi:hypothetical protein
MRPMSFNTEWLTVSIAITVLLLWVEHWFPYPIKAHPIANYSLGVSAILVGITIYCIIQNMVVSIVIVWTFSLAGGVAVGLAYLIDWALNSTLRRHDERRH